MQLTLGACQSLWELPPSHGVGSVPWPSWLPRFPDPPRQRRWSNLRMMYLLLPRWGLRISYVLRLIGTSTPNDYRWLPLPAALFPLYYVLRPLRWVVMGGRWCFRTALQRLRACWYQWLNRGIPLRQGYRTDLRHEGECGRPLKQCMIAASMEERTEALLRHLDSAFIIRSRLP